MRNYKQTYEAIIADPDYQKNLDWGKPRGGHPEGTVRAHIAELERNLEALKDRHYTQTVEGKEIVGPLLISEEDYWKLKILIHTHDSFKAEATKGAAITDPGSHASLAKAFLAKYCDDPILLDIVQYHDEPFALWNQDRHKGSYNKNRMSRLYSLGCEYPHNTNKEAWDLFVAFNIIDSCTEGKDRAPLLWFMTLHEHMPCKWKIKDILP